MLKVSGAWTTTDLGALNAGRWPDWEAAVLSLVHGRGYLGTSAGV